MREIKRLVLVIAGVLLFIVFYYLCISSAQEAREYYDVSSSDTLNLDEYQDVSVADMVHEYVLDNIETQITITGVGDIMFYDYQTSRAYDEDTGEFDFTASFQYISSYLEDASFVLGNLEGTMAGANNGAGSNDYGYYADVDTLNFNIPESAADALASAGFDMLTTANNHVLDSGIEGVSSTIDYITQAGLEQTGTFTSEDEDRYVITNVSGINVGVIAYTNFVNEEIDDEYSYIINNLNSYTEENIAEMCSQIEEMKDAGAQLVVVNLHFGEKYVTEVSDEERDLATQLVEAGADIIFGSYPHVVKPMEVITVEDEDGEERTGVVFYSLGNFISSMQYQTANGYDRDLGAVATVTVSCDEGEVSIDGVKIVPIYVDWTDEDIAVLPICEAYENSEAFADRFEDDDLAYIDEERIEEGYTSVIETLIGDSDLTYTYSDYAYWISW